MLDAIIVGGGPAGLSAALILGRCRRNVIVFDNGRPRNAYTHGMHGYLSRDGMPPGEFLETCRKEIEKYITVKIIDSEVTDARKLQNSFEITISDGQKFQSKKLLLATGVVDILPKFNGIASLWGKSVFNCPYCDGWEFRDKKIAVYGKSDRGFNLALTIKTTWAQDVMLFTDGDCELSHEQIGQLKRNGIPLNDKHIDCLSGNEGMLTEIIFKDGSSCARDVLFFNTPSFLRSKLLDQLGCPYTEEEGPDTGKYEKTKVPGLYVAGNILREVQLVIVAASQGTEAAFGINSALAKEARIP
jgi:thioredoxin reductase